MLAVLDGYRHPVSGVGLDATVDGSLGCREIPLAKQLFHHDPGIPGIISGECFLMLPVAAPDEVSPVLHGMFPSCRTQGLRTSHGNCRESGCILVSAFSGERT